MSRILGWLTLLLGLWGVPSPLHADPLAEAYRRGMAAFERGDYAAAVPWFERALALAEQRLGSNDPELATDLVNLAEVYRLTGRLDEAERLYRRALELDRRNPRLRPEQIAVTLNDLALLERMRGRFDAAEAHYREALALFERELGPRHPNVARVLANMAQLELARGRTARALRLARRARAIVLETLPADDPTRRAIEAGFERIRAEQARARTDAAASGRAKAGAGGLPATARAIHVQLAALRSREAAERAARELASRWRRELAGLAPRAPVPVDLPGRGRFWRVLFGPTTSIAEARGICAAIRRRGGACRVLARAAAPR